jgi:MATE family multidrug resistance protein
MTLKEHFKKNFTLAYPVVIGQLGHIMVSVADTAMVGQVGVIPLAAATFAGTFYHILMLFGIGVSYAITPLVAATEQSNHPRILTFLQNGFVMNLILGVLLFLAGFAVVPFLGYFGQEPAVADEAAPYLVVALASLIPLMVFQTFRQFAEGLSDTFNPMVISLIANLLNVFLNWILIFGKLGFPAMGLLGAGYATLAARVVMALLMIWAVRRRSARFQYRFDFAVIKRMLKIGVPSGLQYVFEVGAFATAAIMVGWISAEALAAHQIALNLAAISYMAATGIAAASTIRIGNQMGLKDLRNLKIAGITSFISAAAFMSVSGLIFILFRYQLVGLYVNNPEVEALAASLMIIAAAFQISDGLQAVGLGVLRGLTDVKIPTLVTFFAYWMVSIPTGYVLAFVFDLGINGIWYALLTGLSLAAILHILRFRNQLRRLRF